MSEAEDMGTIEITDEDFDRIITPLLAQSFDRARLRMLQGDDRAVDQEKLDAIEHILRDVFGDGMEAWIKLCNYVRAKKRTHGQGASDE